MFYIAQVADITLVTGVLRISMLRTIATMTHAAQECDIDDASLVSLLRLAYLGSGKIVALKDINLNDNGD